LFRAVLAITERLSGTAAETAATLTLPFDLRQRSRMRTRLDSGEDAGLLLPRGTVLRDGDLLRTDNGLVVRVVAAAEDVSTAASADPTRLARAAYHLGNRHIPLQIGAGWLRYRYDHVLDAMMAELGLRVIREQAPFEPEAGAYAQGHTHHGH
jgi:urease accessory protein